MGKYTSDDNRSMQLNDNNDRYYSSRGIDRDELDYDFEEDDDNIQGENMSFFSSIDEIDFGEDGYIWSYYDERLVYEIIDKANSLLDSVYEGHPPPSTKIEVHQFFEDLFALDI